MKRITEDLVMGLIMLLFAAATATAQPWSAETMSCCEMYAATYGTPPTLIELAKPDETNPVKVLGVFQDNRQASTVLTAYGIASMLTGSYLQGKAAHHIQYHGATGGSFDNYHVTRGAGLGLQVSGAAAYGGGFVLRDRKYKHPVLGAIGEAAVLFVANSLVSRASYRMMKTKYN